MTHLEGVDDFGMTIMLHVVEPLQSQDRLVVLSVPGLRLKIFLEVVLQGGERLGMEPAIGVEAHKVVEHNLELMEVVHEAVSVGFTADCQVPTDFLTSLSIASQLFVPGCPQGDLVDFFIKLSKGRKRHFEVTRRCVRCS